MTSSDVLQLVLRRWYLMALGAALSLAVLYSTTHQPPVYWTQFNILLIAPESSKGASNVLRDPRRVLYPMAGVIVRDLNGGRAGPLLASPDTMLVGTGVRRGVEVRLPNQGSQWQPVFQANHLDVQVVDSSPAAVAVAADRVMGEVASVLSSRQEDRQIDRGARITALASSTDPVVYQVGGNRMRAAVATGVAGAASTTVAVFWLDRLLLLRRGRRAVS